MPYEAYYALILTVAIITVLILRNQKPPRY